MKSSGLHVYRGRSLRSAIAAIIASYVRAAVFRPRRRSDAVTCANARAARSIERQRVEVGLGLLDVGLAAGPFLRSFATSGPTESSASVIAWGVPQSAWSRSRGSRMTVLVSTGVPCAVTVEDDDIVGVTGGTASRLGRRRHLRSRTTADSGMDRYGLNSATGRPSRVTVKCSPAATRSTRSRRDCADDRHLSHVPTVSPTVLEVLADDLLGPLLVAATMMRASQNDREWRRSRSAASRMSPVVIAYTGHLRNVRRARAPSTEE